MSLTKTEDLLLRTQEALLKMVHHIAIEQGVHPHVDQAPWMKNAEGLRAEIQQVLVQNEVDNGATSQANPLAANGMFPA